MRMEKTKAQERQEIVAKYREAGGVWPTDSKTIASWAVRKKLWVMPRRSAIDVCARELSEAMREEYTTDRQGRRIRQKHSLRISEELPDGKHKQLVLWVDIDEMTPEQMEEASQWRRRQIFTDCRQLKNDLDSYNENWNKGEPIQMLFDFTEDLEESEQPVEYDGITA